MYNTNIHQIKNNTRVPYANTCHLKTKFFNYVTDQVIANCTYNKLDFSHLPCITYFMCMLVILLLFIIVIDQDEYDVGRKARRLFLPSQ